LRWTLAKWGTAAYPFAALAIALVVSRGKHLPLAFAYVLAAPEPVSVCMGYGIGYLTVQYRVRNPQPSFLQSQLFGACAFVGMFTTIGILRLLVPSGTPAAVALVVVIPLKMAAGAVTSALIYPWLSHKRSPAGRYRSAASRRAYLATADGRTADEPVSATVDAPATRGEGPVRHGTARGAAPRVAGEPGGRSDERRTGRGGGVAASTRARPAGAHPPRRRRS
jgi:hypothetical protein